MVLPAPALHFSGIVMELGGEPPEMTGYMEQWPSSCWLFCCHTGMQGESPGFAFVHGPYKEVFG